MGAAYNKAIGNEIDEIFTKQEAHKLVLRQTTASARIDKLKEIRSKITKESAQIYDALKEDFRKPKEETELTEIMPTIVEISESIKNLQKWMRPVFVDTPIHLMGSKSEIRLESKGRVLLISPWNYPFHLTIAPLVNAISAGNTVIIKPSELTPNTSRYLRKFVSEIFSPEEIAVIEGDASVATALLERPFDHIFFTGSTPVGKIVMAAAAKNLTSVTLELGGKSPTILDDTADIKDAAKKICWGKFLNAGQTCVAPDYLLVSESKLAEFESNAVQAIKELYGPNDDARKHTPDFCRIVNKKHFQRLKKLFDAAIKEGARVVIGGKFDEKENYVAPTILADVAPDSVLMKEEIFGPILPVIAYKTINRCIENINAGDKPLALYVFSTDARIIEKIMTETSSGGACVNDVVIHLGNPRLPFGGVNHSGMGSYHGNYGFRAFSHEKAILHQFKLFSPMQMMYPPYTSSVFELIKKTLKYFL